MAACEHVFLSHANSPMIFTICPSQTREIRMLRVFFNSPGFLKDKTLHPTPPKRPFPLRKSLFPQPFCSVFLETCDETAGARRKAPGEHASTCWRNMAIQQRAEVRSFPMRFNGGVRTCIPVSCEFPHDLHHLPEPDERNQNAKGFLQFSRILER